jgi:hypothetical protein
MRPMPDLPFLERFAGQSTDELIDLYGRYRTDSLVLAFEQALQAKLIRSALEKLTVEERDVLAIEAFEREANNGGFDQLFFNVSSDLTQILADALERIGCPATADTVRAASVGHVLQDETAREAELERCDQRFYARDENIEEAPFEFIKKHRGAIAT